MTVIVVLVILSYRRRRVPVKPLIERQLDMTLNPLYVPQGISTNNDGSSNNSAELPHRPYSLNPHPRSEPEGGNVYSRLHVALDSSREDSSLVQQARPPAPTRQVKADHYDSLGETQDAVPFSRRQDGIQQARPPAPTRQVKANHYDSLGGTRDAVPFTCRFGLVT